MEKVADICTFRFFNLIRIKLFNVAHSFNCLNSDFHLWVIAAFYKLSKSNPSHLLSVEIWRQPMTNLSNQIFDIFPIISHISYSSKIIKNVLFWFWFFNCDHRSAMFHPLSEHYLTGYISCLPTLKDKCCQILFN